MKDNNDLHLQIIDDLPYSHKWATLKLEDQIIPGVVWDKHHIYPNTHSLALYRDWPTVHFQSPWYEIEAKPRTNYAATKRDVEILTSVIGKTFKPSKTIIDVHCGSGRHAVQLAKLGFKVIGIEEVSRPRNNARQNAKRHHVSCIFTPATPPYYSKFQDTANIVISMYNSMGYTFSKDDDFVQLAQMVQLLKPEGYIVLDIRAEAFQMRRYAEKPVTYIDRLSVDKNHASFGISIFMETQKYWHNKILGAEEKIIVTDGKESFIAQHMTYGWRTYSIEEISTMLANAGAQVVKVHNDYYSKPENSGERVFVLAKRSA